jgi:hypothetical protein
VVRDFIGVEQQRRWLADVEHNDIDVAIVGDVAERGSAVRLQRHVG